MKNIDTLLVALDLTEMDDILIPYLANLGKSLPDLKRVTFIHNIRFDNPEDAQRIAASMDTPLAEIIHEMLCEKTEEGFNSFCPGIETKVIVAEQYSTPKALTEAALKQNASILVLGKKVTFQGSGLVTEMLFRIPDFHIPILMVPETAYHKTRDILVATDFSRGSKTALEYGIYFRDALQADLDCQHVYDIPIHYFPYIPTNGLQEKMKANAERNWKRYLENHPELEKASLHCTFTFSNKNNVAQAIYHHALRTNKDLIIVNSKGKGEITSHLIGSVALRLVKMDMHIPLLVTNKRRK